MRDIAQTRIRPLSEEIIDGIIEAAGGRRAHPDQDRRAGEGKRGADYVLGQTIIELKILEDEGMEGVERRRKLADLFLPLAPEKPVHVLDRMLLDETGRRLYDRAVERPLKNAVRKSRGQIAQTRSENPDATTSVLMIVNSANTALDHDEIKAILERRARNDTDHLDGVIVAGAYLHSDGFESVALWPFEYVAIRPDRDFAEADALRAAFHAYAKRAMTEAIVGVAVDLTKAPLVDTGFDLDGKTFVKPTPPLGTSSDFYVRGRPRRRDPGYSVPPVALIHADLDRSEWTRFRDFFPDEDFLGDSYAAWMERMASARKEGAPAKPLVTIPIDLEGWLSSLGGRLPDRAFASMMSYAKDLFDERMEVLLDQAADLETADELPDRFIVAHVEQIGQDEANDVSMIQLFETLPGQATTTRRLAENLRIPFQHAGCLGAAYAVELRAHALYWTKDKTYAWT